MSVPWWQYTYDTGAWYGNPWFGNGGGDGGGGGINIDELMSKYFYTPRHTPWFEDWSKDMTARLTGQGGYGVNDIPFELGLPTTGLYDALTRGIKEQYLGTPGGPQGGRINDLFAQANQMGIPEYGLNQSRLANQDLNNSLLDTAAKLNENEKNRLLQILGLGTQLGSNTYGQNLNQHRAGAQLALTGTMADANLAQQIQAANQGSIDSLLGGIAGLAGSYFGGPAGGMMAQQGVNQLTQGGQQVTGAGQFGGGAGVSRGGLPYFGNSQSGGSSRNALFN